MKRLEPAMAESLSVAKSAPDIINRERAAALQTVHEEISRSLDFIHKERVETSEYMTKEREAALKDLRQTIHAEQKALLVESEQISRRTVDYGMIRLSLLTAAWLVALFLGLIVLLFIARRIFAPTRKDDAKEEA